MSSTRGRAVMNERKSAAFAGGNIALASGNAGSDDDNDKDDDTVYSISVAEITSAAEKVLETAISSYTPSVTVRFVNSGSNNNESTTTTNSDNSSSSTSGTGGTTNHDYSLTRSGARGRNNRAFASGTLLGELGPELVVTNGRYFIAGQHGAEFLNLADDAIVFNHL